MNKTNRLPINNTDNCVTGDNIVVTVHAPEGEGEFEDTDVGSEDSDDEDLEMQSGEEVPEVPPSQPVEVSRQKRRNSGQVSLKRSLCEDPEIRQMIEEMVQERINSSGRATIVNKTNPDKVCGQKGMLNITQSPSESTIYRPALANNDSHEALIIDKISKFVENVRSRMITTWKISIISTITCCCCCH